LKEKKRKFLKTHAKGFLQKKISAKSSQKEICAKQKSSAETLCKKKSCNKKNLKHRFESKKRKFLKTHAKGFLQKKSARNHRKKKIHATKKIQSIALKEKKT
jgi:hypothetical protein